MAEGKDRTDIILAEDNTASWKINLEGSIQGLYTGTFVFRCYLTPLQQIAAGKERRELLGNNPEAASDLEKFMAFALTQLKYRVIKAPPFWNSTIQESSLAGDLPDEEVISAVLDAAVSAELRFKDQLKTKKGEALDRAKKAVEERLKQQEEETTGESQNPPSGN